MSQEQPQRPCEDQEELIKYGDVSSIVQDNLVQKIDASSNESETRPLAPPSALTMGEALQATVLKTGKKVVNQNDGANNQPIDVSATGQKHSPITIGEALQATVLTAGQKAVDRSDAAAIQAAEVRATGQTNIMPGGLAATAQSAAQINARSTTSKKITLADVLSDAASKLPKDRPVTRQDAEGVLGAEFRNNPNISTYPGGVAASVVEAARMNQSFEQHKN
ncbi:late embryogenesis abundant protein 47 [Beta vulgaris subsp. vulgaris]|uniref:late embryogenesis abundant protein 47 n=1 Tax=Beta vulgaris subsp. vulgaris TaxID=3555 RepID=UPI002037166A|nr:late embryogenesis abundant protein 47 [Beta vulgaris subsp. vulgaris]